MQVADAAGTGTGTGAGSGVGNRDHNGDDVVAVRDLIHVLGHWDPATSPLELDFVVAQWGATSGRDLSGDVDGNKVVDRVESRWAKPLLMSELGAGAVQGVPGDEKTLFSETHQARVYEEQIAMLKEIPFLAGLSPWILQDFRSPRRVLKDVQDFYNRNGLVSERGLKKAAFHVLQRWYRELAHREGNGRRAAGRGRAEPTR